MQARWVRAFQLAAGGTVLLRGGIVGANFAIMVFLAAQMGFTAFGELAFAWGAVMVLATVVSCGGPLVLLRALTDGSGMGGWRIACFALIWPAGLTGLIWLPLQSLWPLPPWGVILAAAVAVNLLSCLASVVRALGYVQTSMVLRDGVPQLTLLSAWMLLSTPDAAGVLWLAAMLMLGLGLLGGAACLVALRGKAADRHVPSDAPALWATSILGGGVAQMDIVVGGLLMAPEVLGIYAILRRVANLVALPVSVATWVSAAEISAAKGAEDIQNLQNASAAGSRVAFTAGAVLFALGLMSIPLLHLVLPAVAGAMPQAVFLVLLCAAFGQVWFASGYTVATLCGLGRETVMARGTALMIYLGSVGLLSTALSPALNAALYGCAITASSVLLWWRLKGLLGVDTSAGVLWPGKEGEAWKPS
ncbi:MAG: hypothetical protein AAFU41_04875 [Pseudomonadota bacterium]